jgi:hypothetical protein
MRPRTLVSSFVICTGSLAAAACGPAGQPVDWRTQQIAAAEDKIRSGVGDPAAQFAKVQVTGDDKTGQICGEVQPAHNTSRRFIVYIDATAGPYVEGGAGGAPIGQDGFDFAWQNDCLAEGYSQ